MKNYTCIPVNGKAMAAYDFEVVVEQDEDAWHAYCPAPLRQGGATWDATRDEALENTREVVQMVVTDLTETGECLPQGMYVSAQPLDSVTL